MAEIQFFEAANKAAVDTLEPAPGQIFLCADGSAYFDHPAGMEESGEIIRTQLGNYVNPVTPLRNRYR